MNKQNFPSSTMNIWLAPLILINGLLSLGLGLFLWLGYGIGDPPGLDLTIKADNIQFAVNIIIASIIYLIVGLEVSLYMKNRHEWTKYVLVLLAMVHLFGAIFVILNREWISVFVCFLSFLISIVMNIAIIWVSLKHPYEDVPPISS